MCQGPLVTVIMPTYQAEKYIGEAIDSMMTQTYRHFELLVIDDASKDHTRKIVMEYAKKDNRIRLIDGPQNGIAAALNYGIERSTGKYVARMDADDIALPERLEKQVAAMEKDSELGVCATQILALRGNELVEAAVCKEQYEEILCDTMFNNNICHPTVMFRKKVLDQGWRYQEHILAEDYDMWTRMLPNVKFQALSDILLYYRIDCEEKLTVSKHQQVRDAASKIIRSYLSVLFEADFSGFELSDFVPDHAKYELLSEGIVCVVRQYQLLNYIYRLNEEKNVIRKELMLERLNSRFQSWAIVFGVDRYIERNGKIIIGDGDEKGLAILNMLTILDQKRSFILYGLGLRGRRFLEKYQHSLNKKWKLIALADKKSGNIDGMDTVYKVVTKDKIKDFSFDYILVSTDKYFDDIFKELSEEGICQDCILRSSVLENIL